MAGTNWRGKARSLWPEPHGWLRLWASPSSYLLVVAALVTLVAKITVVSSLPGVSAWPLWAIAVSAADIAIYLGLAAMFAIGERRVPWLLAVTIPLALVIGVLATINGIYLTIAGDQLNWQSFAVGLDRFGEVTGITSEVLGELGPATIGVIAVILAAPFLSLWWLRRNQHSLHPVAQARPRAHAASVIAVPALLVALIAPSPGDLALARVDGNAVVATYRGWLDGDDVPAGDQQWFTGYQPSDLVGAEARRALASGPKPNLIVVVLESTRRDVTSLDGGKKLATTPHLEALAERGVDIQSARAVVPHTTKSLFSMFCGRLPLMQVTLYEGSSTLQVECLPAVLRSVGYATGFFQSALGVFEDRPRLVRQLGFDDFAAWEDIQGQPLGYLASDDLSLAPALARWLDQLEPDRPFAAVLLTSATHHPYRLSDRAAEHAAEAGKPTSSGRDRYLRLVEAEDRLIGEVIAMLDQRGLTASTIVVAVGDHGEGFGDRGVRQHDNNFFDEGLRVPWVMAGPGVPNTTVEVPASLVDFAATTLAPMGVDVSDGLRESSPGRNLLGPVAGDRLLVFSCWYDARCRGFVSGSRKVVVLPEQRRMFWFDLAADPSEQSPRVLDDELIELLDQANRLIESHRTPDWPDRRPALTGFGSWRCAEGQPCVHPESPPGGLFGN